MSSPTLRPGTAADAPAVADLWHRSWHLAHAGHVPEGLTAARTREAFGARTPGRVDVTTVAELDGRVVGFTIIDGAELEQLFVAADQHGHGVGALLLADAEASIAAAGHPVAWLAVVAGNARARAFYAKHGWVDEGDLPYVVTADGQEFVSPCRRYTKPVAGYRSPMTPSETPSETPAATSPETSAETSAETRHATGSETPSEMTGRIETLLVLGADGDLTRRLMLPGLASLLASDWSEGRSLQLLGAGLSDLTDAEWQERVTDAFAGGGSGERVSQTAEQSRYRQCDVTSVEELRSLLSDCDGTPALFFALPPAITARACRALQEVELPEGTVLAMEKPFGTDRARAHELNELVSVLVPETHVFRVDHFLGRSDVLNLLGLRFANRLLEPVWSNQHVESIEIVYDESLGLEGRAGYYDKAGALVDMIQSHLLQVMALLMMDPISRVDERELRDAKGQVLRATHLRGTPQEASRRARYTAGTLDERQLPAYADEPGVDASRQTETLAELTVEVDTWRWSGVPVRLRSGKALGRPRKEAVVTLKPTPRLPDGLEGHDTRDEVTIGFKPARLALHLDVSGPGDPFELETASADAELGSGDLPAYGEVLAGILDGDPLLAVRGDNAEECWRIVEPVLAAWRDGGVPLDTYAAGSAGPDSWT